MNQLREQLQEAEAQIRALREERARVRKLFESAKATAAEHQTEQSTGAAVAAKDALQQVEAKLEQAGDRQVALLRQLGDAEAGRAGFTLPGVSSGWDQAASKLDLAEGVLRVDVPGASLVQAQVGSLPTSPTSGSARIPASPTPVGAAISNRFVYPVFPQQPFADGDTVATDFVVNFTGDQLTGAVSGVERAPHAVTDKATYSPAVGLANPAARQFAVVLDGISSRVFDSQQALRDLLGNEVSRLLDRAIDAHCVNVLQSAAPPSGSSGSDLIAKIRNGISAMETFGGAPLVIALSASDAAALDLSTQPTSGGYVFVPGTDSQAVVWRLQVRVVPGISHPTLISPQQLGVLYVGSTGSILVDPYGPNLKANKVSIRVECEGRLHIRDLSQGCYVIA